MTSIQPGRDDLPVIETKSEGDHVDVAEVRKLLSTEWVRQALDQNHPGVAIESVRIDRIVSGTGMLVWLRLQFDDAGERHGLPDLVVVKMGLRQDPKITFGYEIEMMAYRDVFPRFPINTPKCFYAGTGPGHVSSAVILEDLSRRDVRFCHASRPYDRDTAQAFIDALAEFHARTWDDPILTDGSWEWAIDNARVAESFVQLRESVTREEHWAQCAGLPRFAAISVSLHDRPRFIAALEELEVRNRTHPRVILAGDLHPGNLYVEKSGRPGFFDFAPRIHAAMADVCYLLVSGLDIADRRKWERELVESYGDRLRARGVESPASEGLWDSYCENVLWGLMLFMTTGVQSQTEAYCTLGASRFGAAALDHDTLGRLI